MRVILSQAFFWGVMLSIAVWGAKRILAAPNAVLNRRNGARR